MSQYCPRNWCDCAEEPSAPEIPPVRVLLIGDSITAGLVSEPEGPPYARLLQELQPELEQPIPGWFGHDDMFAFESSYRPAADIRRFTVGTPPVVSLRCAQRGTVA